MIINRIKSLLAKYFKRQDPVLVAITGSDGRGDEFGQTWTYDMSGWWSVLKPEEEKFQFLVKTGLNDRIYLFKNIDLFWTWVQKFLKAHPEICLRDFGERPDPYDLTFSEIKDEWSQYKCAYFFIAPKSSNQYFRMAEEFRFFGEFSIVPIKVRR